MAENVYKVIELVGTSTESWEKAATAAVTRASKTLRDLRVAEVCELDLQLKNGKVEAYRAKSKCHSNTTGKGSCSGGCLPVCRSSVRSVGVRAWAGVSRRTVRNISVGIR